MDSVRGTAFLQFGELLSQRGASLRDHLSPHCIALDVVGSYDKTFSYSSLVQIFEGSAHALNLPDLGLELASRQGSVLLGPLQRLAQSAPTVGEGLVALLRYMRFYSPSIHFRLERRPGRSLLYFENSLPCSEQIPQIVEKSVLHGRLIVAEMLGKACRPEAVLFRHKPQSTTGIYRNYFDCPVQFEQSHNALVLSNEELQHPCANADSMLHEIVRFYLEAHCNLETDLADEVKRHIQALLPKQRCNLEQVALRMGIHSRTLQRHLANDGIEFEHLLESLRCHQAERLLRDTELGVGQIARELGYRRTSSFCRAHQRWFSCTPQERRLQFGIAAPSSMNSRMPS